MGNARIVGSIVASKVGEAVYNAYLPTAHKQAEHAALFEMAPLFKVVLESVTGLLGAMGASKLYELID